MKKTSVIAYAIMLMLGSISCSQTIGIRYTDYQYKSGGDNQNIAITANKYAVSYDGKTVTGIPSKPQLKTTALIYKDESNKQVAVYSNINSIQIGHIDYNNKAGKRDSIKLTVARYFYIKNEFKHTIFYNRPVNEYKESLHINENGRNSSKIEENFFLGKPIDIMLIIENTGTLPAKEEFIVVDFLPEFLQFQGASYETGDAIDEVAYDVHAIKDEQVLVFKVRPDQTKGLSSKQKVYIKITVQPDVIKFKNNYKRKV